MPDYAADDVADCGDSRTRPDRVSAGEPWMRALAKLPRVLLQRCATPPRTRTPLCCGTRTRASMADDASAQHTHAFGPHVLRASEVFVESRLSLGFVNLKPVVPGALRRLVRAVCTRLTWRTGHVLFIPRRVVPRAAELTSEEIADLWLLAHRCAPKLEAHFGASALTFAVQDGAAAGQTVPHVHIHLLPRRLGDFENNDEVYDLVRVRRATCSARVLTPRTRRLTTASARARGRGCRRTWTGSAWHGRRRRWRARRRRCAGYAKRTHDLQSCFALCSPSAKVPKAAA
jgi:bis(5'-adenosyl)-triphosphatase